MHFRRILLCLGLSCVFVALLPELQAAPYGPDGLSVEWTQPDGTRLSLRVFGDEFYARTETEDGYTVVYNPNTNSYEYAKRSADGKKLLPAGIKPGKGDPKALGIDKGAKIDPDAREAIWKERHQKLAPNERKEWAERVKAARQRHGIEPEQAAPGNEAGDGTTGGSEPQSSTPAFAPVTGSYVGLTILVQFPDDPQTGTNDPTNFPTTKTAMENYSNQIGYSGGGNTGSVRDYFLEQSLNQTDYTQVVTEIVTLPQPRAYYNWSDYPTNSTLRDGGLTGRLVLGDAIAELQSSGFDFSALSLNSSNRVIATNVIFAGPTSGVWPDGLWPHRWVMSPIINVGTTQSPIYIYDYQITNANSSNVPIGTFCHENGHLLLKLPDLYDYGGESEGVGNHCLMGAGNHLNGGKTPGPINGYFKDISGWSNVIDVSATDYFTGTLSTTNNEGYRIRKPGSATEYFFIENRGSGDRWATYSPDKGILVWHIDEAVNGNNNEQMTPSLHYEVSLEQADGAFDLENDRDRGDSADAFDSSHTNGFSDTTLPNANWWDGSNSGINLKFLSSPGASMDVQFGLLNPEIEVEYPVGTGLTDGSSTIDLGTVTAGGSSSPITVTIRNTGGSDLTGLSLSKSGTHSADYTLGTLGATTLASGASTTFSVTFSPGALGTRNASIQIASNDSDENPFDIGLIGIGAAPGVLSVSSTAGLASNGGVGGPFSPSSIQYTLENTGGGSINWTAAKSQNWVSLSSSGGSLAGGASTTVTVSINSNANSLASGGYSDLVNFTNTTNGSGDTTRDVALSVTGLSQIYFEDGESGLPPGWTTTGGSAWTVSNASYKSANNSFSAPVPANQITANLDSAGIAIPAGTNSVQIRFWHRHNLETDRAGGRLYLSTDNSNWYDVGSTFSGTNGQVDSVFASGGNGYNSTISNSGGPSARSAFAGGTAWSGNSGAAFKESVVNLTNLAQVAGNNLYLRWSVATDSNDTSTHWYVDDVLILADTGASTSGSLAVTGSTGLSASGGEGGPFTPSFIEYTLQNTGDTSINWNATKTADWITISPPAGSLAAGGSSMVTVSINSNADALSANTYGDTINFINSTNGDGNTSRSVSLEVVPPGTLAVTPGGDLNSSGLVGGPFSPASQLYTLENTGSTSINWSASKSANWVDLSAGSGNLAPGASTSVTVSINGNADALGSGPYSDTVIFTNTSNGNGNTTRDVNLTINEPGSIAVTGTGGLTSAGTLGGPFSPASLQYTVSNPGSTPVDWTASKTAPWVTLSSVSGTIPAGGDAIVTVSINSNADSLSANNYNDTVSFTNTTNGIGDTTRSVSLMVNQPPFVFAGSDQEVVMGADIPWTPEDIAPAAWYDAADLSTITSSGGTVSQWNDKSGNHLNATQTNSSNRPVSGTRTINGNNIIGFTAANSQFLNIPAIEIVGREVWSVFLMDDYTTTASQLLLGGGNNVQVGVNSGTESLRLWRAGASPYSADTKSTATIPVSTPAFAGWLAHTDTKKFSINGVLETTTDNFIGGSMVANYIGRGQYAYMHGAIGELVVTDATLTPTDRMKMEGYLAHKWGQEASLPSTHPHKQLPPGNIGVEVTLAGSASDADPFTTLWSVVGDSPAVIFSDPTALDSTATFTVAGTYQLRLTATDSYGSSSADVYITIVEETPYIAWAGTNGLSGESALSTGNPDGDSLTNLEEFAYGMDPLSPDYAPLAYTPGGDLTTPGLPMMEDDDGNWATLGYNAVFSRRKDHLTSGITYTVEFSADLSLWTASSNGLQVVTGAASSGDYEAVSVPFPASVPLNAGGTAVPKFFRVVVLME